MNAAKNLKDLYEKDGHEWYFKNAQLLKQGKINEIDVENVAEELESMGRGEEDKLESLLKILFLHLLKLKYQPEYEVGIRSWKLSVKEHRMRAKSHIRKNPSLKGHLDDIVKEAYILAVIGAAKETGLREDIFPEEMPFTLEESLQDKWFPS